MSYKLMIIKRRVSGGGGENLERRPSTSWYKPQGNLPLKISFGASRKHSVAFIISSWIYY